MIRNRSLKKIALAVLLGIIFAAGILFFWGNGKAGEIASGLENLNSATVVKIPDYSSINWEIEVIEESEIENL